MSPLSLAEMKERMDIRTKKEGDGTRVYEVVCKHKKFVVFKNGGPTLFPWKIRFEEKGETVEWMAMSLTRAMRKIRKHRGLEDED